MAKVNVTLIPIIRYNMVMLCFVNYCERLVHAKDLCEMHYRRLLRRGQIGSVKPLRNQRRFAKGTDEDRFWLRVDKTATCWLWTVATTTAGYGEFQVNKKTVYAHRWAYEHFKGLIPIGLHIDHLCFVRHCVNPQHLEAVTLAENNRRAWERTSGRVVGR